MKRLVLLFLLVISLVSCGTRDSNTANDIRKVKVGISSNELKYLLGEPINIKIETDYEIWRFIFDVNCMVTNRFDVIIVNNKVESFTTN